MARVCGKADRRCVRGHKHVSLCLAARTRRGYLFILRLAASCLRRAAVAAKNFL